MQDHFALTDREIHLWALSSGSSRSTAARFHEMLSQDELQRASRFTTDELQRSFIIARGTLRTLLGRYVGIEPRNVQLLYGPHGKPSVATCNRISFNTSHSGGMVLYGITRGCEIGIDIELVRPLPNMNEIAQQFFCSEEISEFMSLPALNRELGFYRFWTRKEAYVKAVGRGLSLPLNSFRVTLAPARDARLLHQHRNTDIGALKPWTLGDIELSGPYVASLVYQDCERPLRLTCLEEPTDLITM
jgi:4'-phosphopantetheinyl transferase